MKRLLICAATALLSLTAGNVHAQLWTASAPDNFWYADTGYIAGINSAEIEYQDNGANHLMVSTYYNNYVTSGGVVFTDKNSGFTYHWDYGNPATLRPNIVGSPDIIVGNSAANPTNEFIVATVCMVTTSTPTTYWYVLDFFRVTYTTPGAFTVTHTGGSSWTAGLTYTIHIDVIAEAGNTTATGYPWCDKFVVTWDDLTTGDIYVQQGSLNSGGFTSPIITISGGYSRPDVAAVERKACAACAIEDFALLAMTGNNQTELRYAEVNMTTSIPVPPTLYYTTSFVDWPRIDAPDDFNINDTASGNAYFKMSAHVNTTESYSFDALLGTFTFLDNIAGSGLNNAGVPAIAFGGDSQTQYTIAQEADGPAQRRIYMEPIDWSNSTLIAPSPTFTTYWFEVNSVGLNFMNGGFLTAVSTPCNNPGAHTLVSWASHDLSTNTSTVSWESSVYNPFSTSGYAFRANSRQPVASEEEYKGFGIHPNPAVTTINLHAGLPTGKYTITDMLGREQLSGAVTGTQQVIDISKLPAGNYILKAGGNTGKFVKQ